MTWCSRFDSDDHDRQIPRYSAASLIAKICPSCGHPIQALHQARGNSAVYEELPGLPAGVKFDPTDQELLEHLEGKSKPDLKKLHPLIDDFIPTIQGHTGICYTHPEKLPGVTRDGLIRHFFHRPSKAYTTGTRKRRKIHTNDNGCETRWHKTGKTRPVLVGGKVKGYKKILVLYNYGKQRKPEKTNWVMHQYHLGSDEEERDGELIVSKIFYQTQPRQCNSMIMMKDLNFKKRFKHANEDHNSKNLEDESTVKHYSSSQISYNKKKHHTSSPPRLMHNLIVPSRESLCLN